MIKSVEIITYHKADNYGSVLQAYSLRKAIKDNIIDECSIINYVTKNQKKMYKLFAPFLKRGNIKYNIKTLFNLKSRLKRKRNFNTFRKDKLNINNREFNQFINYPLNNNTAYICGSDQIWNTKIADYNDNYFLDFAKNHIKISYAASFGGVNPQWNVEQKNHVSFLLKDFNAVSVRENIAFSEISNLYNGQIIKACDPVFLLEKKEWEKLISKRIYKFNYIFFYSIDYNESSVEIARWYGDKFNLPVIILYTSRNTYSVCGDRFKIAKSQGVEDFLSLIFYAKFVLSGSFHGTAFSLIFNKPFYRIQKIINDCPLKDDRVCTLFETLNVKQREINILNYKEYARSLFEIDFSLINGNIENERYKALSFLKANIMQKQKKEELING